VRIDCKAYEVNKKFIIAWYDNWGHKKPEDSIASMAVATGTPCVVCAFWIGEYTGWPQWSLDSIERLIKFYGYDQILNMPEGCPIKIEEK
jgi:hypothetical protein